MNHNETEPNETYWCICYQLSKRYDESQTIHRGPPLRKTEYVGVTITASELRSIIGEGGQFLTAFSRPQTQAEAAELARRMNTFATRAHHWPSKCSDAECAISNSVRLGQEPDDDSDEEE